MRAIVVSDRDFAGAQTLAGGWRIACETIDADAIPTDAASILSAEEQARFAAMRAGGAADLRRMAHVLRRRAAGARLGATPETVEFGPPRAPLADGSFVSLSHTDGAVAVALCDAPVGIDIEPVRARGDAIQLAARFFAPEEAAAIAALAPGDAAYAFAWRWTAKEALLKATGVNLGAALATPIPDGAPPFAATVADTRLFVFAPSPGYVCTVARYSPNPPKSAYLMSR